MPPYTKPGIPRITPAATAHYSREKIALIVADLLIAEAVVAEDEGGDRLFGHHVAGVMSDHFSDVREIHAVRAQLERDGYWELLEVPPGEYTPAKRVTDKGRELAATTGARLSPSGYRKILALSVPATGRTKKGKVEGARRQRRQGQTGVARREEKERLLLQCLADHLWLEQRGTPVTRQVSDRIFQRHSPKRSNPGTFDRAKLKDAGWLEARGRGRGATCIVTVAGMAHLEARQVNSDLTEADAERLTATPLKPRAA